MSRETLDTVLLEPFRYLASHPGKNIRSQMVAAFNHWLHVPDDIIGKIQEIVEMLHTASLLIDDIEDNSILRRGVPVAHHIYGVAQTINCGNYVYFQALQKVILLGNRQASLIFAEELCNLHRGQGMDLYWRDTNTVPTEAEYLEMIKNKTGGLLRLAVGLMQAFSSNTQDYTPLVNILGIHFQVRDDYINLSSAEYMKSKGFCEDITEGKFSLPIIHSIRSNPTNREILNILKQKSTDREILAYAVRYIHGTGSIEYTRKFVARMEQSARDEIARLGGNATLYTILDLLRQSYQSENVADEAPAEEGQTNVK